MSFWKLDVSHKRYNFVGLFGFVFILVVFSFLFIPNSVLGDNPIIFVVIFSLIIFGVPIMLYLIQRAALQRHTKAVMGQAQKNGWQYSPLAETMNIYFDMVLPRVVRHENSSAKQQNLVKGDGWQYCDYLYDFYHRYKGFRWKAGEKTYAVMMVELPRRLPDVLFDSGASKGKQFQSLIAANQRLQLEGNFNEYFTTYVPQSYQIDSLSFITPEVMESLIRAHRYDIQIIHNRLHLFAPISGEGQIADMAEKIMDIKQKLLNNIVTYRDERLPYADGRSMVSEQGRRLQESKIPLYIIIIVATWVIFYVWTLLR